MKIYTYHMNRGWSESSSDSVQQFLAGYSNTNILCLQIPKTEEEWQGIKITNLQVINKNLNPAKQVEFKFVLYYDKKQIGEAILRKQPEKLSKIEYITLDDIEINAINKDSNSTDKIYCTIECSETNVWIQLNQAGFNFISTLSSYQIITKSFNTINEIYSSQGSIELKRLNQLGYNHIGWKKENTEEDILKFVNNSNTILIQDIDTNCVYVAVWEPVYIDINFKSENLESDFDFTIKAKLGDIINYSPPQYYGYNFISWNNNSKSGQIITLKITEDYFSKSINTITFTAQYKKEIPKYRYSLKLNFISFPDEGEEEGTKTQELSYTFQMENSKIFLPANYHTNSETKYGRVQYWQNTSTNQYLSPYIGYTYQDLISQANDTFKPIGFGNDIDIYPLFIKGENNQWIPINNLYEKGELEWK